MITKYIRRQIIANVTAWACIVCWGYLYASDCPNTQADTRSQPICRSCPKWENQEEGKPCTYNVADATVFASCWEDSAKGRRAVPVWPQVTVNGEVQTYNGTCANGICVGQQKVRSAQYTAVLLQTDICEP